MSQTLPDDIEIWRIAVERESVIVTKDEDFAVWRVGSEEQLPTVIWLRVGNTRKAELLNWMESLLPDIVAALDAGERLIEVS
jgi:predicted nuclease of predicted toxin-antitoxin system